MAASSANRSPLYWELMRAGVTAGAEAQSPAAVLIQLRAELPAITASLKSRDPDVEADSAVRAVAALMATALDLAAGRSVAADDLQHQLDATDAIIVVLMTSDNAPIDQVTRQFVETLQRVAGELWQAREHGQ